MKFCSEQSKLFVSAEKYDAEDDFSKSIEECYRVIRERKANGGKGWPA